MSSFNAASDVSRLAKGATNSKRKPNRPGEAQLSNRDRRNSHRIRVEKVRPKQKGKQKIACLFV